MSYETKQKQIAKEMQDLSGRLEIFTKSKEYSKGYSDCQKEYEEKLRWIPVEEKLPDIYCCEIAVRKQKYKKKKIKIFLHSGQFKQFCKNHGYTEWRYFL